jgi:hypothetical protein
MVEERIGEMKDMRMEKIQNEVWIENTEKRVTDIKDE